MPLVRRTLLLNWFYWALGVKVGRNVVIDTDDLLGYDLIELQDDCILDAASGVSAITYEAGKPGDKFVLGTMRLEPVCVAERSVVGPYAMVTPGRVAPDSVVLPWSATSNPPALWRGSSRPTHGPEGRSAVNTQDPALGIITGLATMWVTSFLITLLSYPVVGGSSWHPVHRSCMPQHETVTAPNRFQLSYCCSSCKSLTSQTLCPTGWPSCGSCRQTRHTCNNMLLLLPLTC